MLKLCLVAVSAWLWSADKPIDPVMGYWEGTWSTDSDGGKLIARIVALGGDKYDGYFAVEIQGEMRPIKIPLTVKKEGEEYKLDGKFSLGEDVGEAKTSGTIKGDEYTGKTESEQIKAELKMKHVCVGSPTMGAAPPAGAVVLFDGKNLEQWKSLGGRPAGWKVEDGAFIVTPLKGNIVSIPTFQDAKIHIEFKTPFMPTARGQGRGNSGVYVQGLYEVQVLDSFGLPPKDNEAGGIYHVSAPKENACAPPGEWQTYDITFKAPRTDDSGKLTTPGEITVLHNGILIHDKSKLTTTTPGGIGKNFLKEGPILLQDHGNPVSFRNVWFLPIKE